MTETDLWCKVFVDVMRLPQRITHAVVMKLHHSYNPTLSYF